MHKNSQKRIYLRERPYFITANTKDRYPLFAEDIFCELFILHLEICKFQFDLDIYGYKINPEHIHLLFTPGEGFTISDVLKSLKKQTSHNINRILGYAPIHDYEDDDANVPDEGAKALSRLHREHSRIYDTRSRLHCYRNIDVFVKQASISFVNNHTIPKFSRQKSYHDHYIRGNMDLYFHLRYIENQWVKHGLPENKWCYVKY